MKAFASRAVSLLSILIIAGSANPQTNDLAKYRLGTIPDQTVWAGSTRSFLVFHSGSSTMTVNASPQPHGQLALLSSGTNWLFLYVPDPADITPFNVTITVPAVVSQTFSLTPQPDLPPETSVFATDQHTHPVISTAEVSVFDAPAYPPRNINYGVLDVRAVRFVGETVVLEANHTNGLYEAYCNGDRRDLGSLDIIAERVIIRDSVRLKQTDVTIWARELIFEDEGRITTTPEERHQSAGVDASGGLPGVNGLTAGSISLNVGSFTNRTSLVAVLDARGGAGQPGGPGQHGTDGSSVEPVGTSVRVCDSGICKTHTTPEGYQITYWWYTFAGVTVDEGGTKTRPSSGTNAKPSGKPGEGGGGGFVKSSVSLLTSYLNNGGASASPTTPTTAPFNTYKGGEPGSPQNSEHVHFYLTGFLPVVMSSTGVRETAARGADAEIRKASTVTGSIGSYTVLEAPLSWLHPLSLRKVLNRVKDNYLANNIDTARMRLADYAQVLSDFRASAAWQSLGTAHQLEFGQMHDEIRILLQRVEGGLDYFGNPAGWVPMLSFEVTKNMFEREIDRAIETLYLTYWIGNKAKDEQEQVKALSSARDQLRAELEQAQSDYDTAIERLPALESKALNLQSQIQTTQNKLEAEEIRLLQDTREPDWVFGLRFGLKISAMMCQMIPVYQPALGAVGAGLRVASDFDPDTPWASITGAPSIASAYTNSPFAISATDQKQAKDQIDPNQAEAKSFNYAAALQQAGAGLATGVSDIQKFIEDRKAPSAEMLAELERLKSRSPEYKALLEEVELLMAENKRFSEELLATMQQIAILSDTMTHHLLAIDGLNRQVAPGFIVLDERAASYLSAMERRAHDRLLKYHYYMAKASEYRLLKPYTQALDLEGLFLKFTEIADLNAATTNAHNITPAQFTTLRQVYHGIIADLAESIYDQYISSPPEQTVSVRFDLTTDEVAALNSGGTVVLNPHELGFFPLNHENNRIVDLDVYSITTELEGGGAYGSSSEVDLYMEHSGISNLRRDGRIYSFRHYNRLTQNPIVWGARYFPADGDIVPIQPSEASDSLLRSLLSPTASADMLLYSRPSAWADLVLSRNYFDSSGRTILIKSVRLEMFYDFTWRNPSLDLRTLEVLTAKVQQDNQGQTQILETGILPFFIVDKADINQRQHARGRFSRVYRTGAGSVQIAAPAQYGLWKFHRWTDRFGRELTGVPSTNPTITLTAQNDAAVMAQYIPLGEQFVLEAPVLAGGTMILHWNGAADARLQICNIINGQWEDVPDTLGQSQVSIPVSAPTAFFRVVRPSSGTLTQQSSGYRRGGLSARNVEFIP